MKAFKVFRLLALTVVATVCLTAGPITTIFGTAMDINGAAMSSGTDPHYTFGGGTSAVVVPTANSPGLWYHETGSTGIRWVSIAADPNAPTPGGANVDYVFQHAFSLSNYLVNANTVISGAWAVDNWATMVLVNSLNPGGVTIATLPQANGQAAPFLNFSPLTNFSINRTLLVQGLNTLQFRVTNMYSSSFPNGNAVGLRVDITQAQADAAVPEPASFLLIGGGMAALGLLRRRTKA